MITTLKLQRTCLGCMNKNVKNKLIRVVRSKSGEVFVDYNKNSDGRGAYICAKCECIEKAKKKNALRRALKCDVNDEIYQMLLEGVQSGENI